MCTTYSFALWHGGTNYNTSTDRTVSTTSTKSLFHLPPHVNAHFCRTRRAHKGFSPSILYHQPCNIPLYTHTHTHDHLNQANL